MIVKLKAGLGNQMFQYAFGRAASILNNEKLLLDIESFNHQSPKDPHREYGLYHFLIQESIAPIEVVTKYYRFPQKIVRKLYNKFFSKNPYAFYSNEQKNSKGAYCEGYWQTEEYFKKYADTIRKDFTLKEPFGHAAGEAKKELCSLPCPVLVQIRRGDYVSNASISAHHGVAGISYFKTALQIIQKKVSLPITVCFVTDDVPWVQEHIQELIPTGISSHLFISRAGLKDYEEIVLMSYCHHFVISNSSYGWWGAWLNPSNEKIVIAPKQWIADVSVDTTQATPEGWIRV